jgi:hypothetical protein
MIDPDLFVHLSLDELHGNALYDTTEARRNGVARGAKIVVDEEFGQCLELQGDPDSYVEAPSLKAAGASQALTVLCWVKLGALDRTMRLIDLDFPSGKEQLFGTLRLNSNGELHLSLNRKQIGGITLQGYTFTGQRIKTISSTWVHLAFIRDSQGMASFYLNGRPASDFEGAPTPLTRGPGGAGDTGGIELRLSYLGKTVKSATGNVESFKGRVAQYRVYTRALTQREVNWDLEDDRPVAYRYRITHPIDFSLENRDADPTLFMDGHPDGQKMFLRVYNVSRAKLNLAALPNKEVSAENCHFELAFRPGTIAPGGLKKIALHTPGNGWKLGYKEWTKPDDQDSLYLLCSQPGPLPDAGLQLELDSLLPDARYGTRTTLVDFRYKNLKSGGGEAISGSVQQNLDLVNHLGRRTIPLHVGFVGSNLILNNSASPSALRLRVTNVLPKTDILGDPLKSPSTGVLRFNKKSEFVISLDDRPGTDWALNTLEKIGAIDIRYDKKPVSDQSPKAERKVGTNDNPWRWTIPLENLELGPEEHFEIRLENVTASGSSGHSNLYLDYRNVPGYWDGRFTNVIEKTPLIYRDGKVGIGTANPQAQLEVKGTLKVDSLIVNSPPPRIWIAPDLRAGWKYDNFSPPRYFKDTQGMVYLQGHCYYSLPNDVKERENWASTIPIAFQLPSHCAPHTITRELMLPARVEFRFSGQAAYSPMWHVLYIGSSPLPLPTSVFINVRGLIHKMRVGSITEAHIYLDGILYQA